MAITKRFLTFLMLYLVFALDVGAQTLEKDVRVRSTATETDSASFVVDRIHIMMGQNALLTDEILRCHTYGSGSKPCGDNLLVADFWYDGTHRRLHTRSLQIVDVGDPADIRCGRAPGKYPNGINTTGKLDQWQVVCTIGASGWGRKGLTAYQTAIVFGTNSGDDEYRGYMCLSGATGLTGIGPDGSITKPDQLICHMLFTSDGRFIFGYATDSKQRPTIPYTFNGNMEVNGNVVINGDLVVHGTIHADGFVPNSR